MTVKEWTNGPSSGWTPEQASKAATWGVCMTCGAPREMFDVEETSVAGVTDRFSKLVCTAEPLKHPQ